ncbi:hypothetical protein ABLG96_07065 [Nakamurella sp. A5-74]|uniref:Uncharacterized protein n=1 Tax=Nakamurella sp. A5-74 TaxID=3158264 RepID=A0AAU8DSB3_9ACTN
MTDPGCASGPTVLMTTTACTDIDMPDGDFPYSVTAVHRSWTAMSRSRAVVRAAGATGLAFIVPPTGTSPTRR